MSQTAAAWRLGDRIRLVHMAEGAHLESDGTTDRPEDAPPADRTRRRIEPLDFRLCAEVEAALRQQAFARPSPAFVALTQQGWLLSAAPGAPVPSPTLSWRPAAADYDLPANYHQRVSMILSACSRARVVWQERMTDIESALERAALVEAYGGSGQHLRVIADDGVCAVTLAACGHRVDVADTDPYLASMACAQAQAHGWILREVTPPAEDGSSATSVIIGRPLPDATLGVRLDAARALRPVWLHVPLPARLTDTVARQLVPWGFTIHRVLRDTVRYRDHALAPVSSTDLMIAKADATPQPASSAPRPGGSGPSKLDSDQDQRSHWQIRPCRLQFSLATLFEVALPAVSAGPIAAIDERRGKDFELVVVAVGDHVLEAYYDAREQTLDLSLVPHSALLLASLRARIEPYLAGKTTP